MAFYSQFGTTPEYKTITQYSGIQKNNLTNVYWIDGVNPSAIAVTDAMIQAEVKNYINQHGGAIDDSAVYEVFLPVGYYSTLGNATSCGGPHLQYCAYHSNFSFSGHDVKYASMPQPSCGGCQWTGWTTAQNFEHFGTHETREAVTDPDGNAWYDRRATRPTTSAPGRRLPSSARAASGTSWSGRTPTAGASRRSSGPSPDRNEGPGRPGLSLFGRRSAHDARTDQARHSRSRPSRRSTSGSARSSASRRSRSPTSCCA